MTITTGFYKRSRFLHTYKIRRSIQPSTCQNIELTLNGEFLPTRSHVRTHSRWGSSLKPFDPIEPIERNSHTGAQSEIPAGYQDFVDTVADDFSAFVSGHFFTELFPANGSSRFWSDLRATHRMASALRMNADIR